MELHSFSKAFDYSTEKWNEFYDWKREMKEQEEAAALAAAEAEARRLEQEMTLEAMRDASDFHGLRHPHHRDELFGSPFRTQRFSNSKEPLIAFFQPHKKTISKFLRSLTQFVPDAEMKAVSRLHSQRQKLKEQCTSDLKRSFELSNRGAANFSAQLLCSLPFMAFHRSQISRKLHHKDHHPDFEPRSSLSSASISSSVAIKWPEISSISESAVPHAISFVRRSKDLLSAPVAAAELPWKIGKNDRLIPPALIRSMISPHVTAERRF